MADLDVLVVVVAVVLRCVYREKKNLAIGHLLVPDLAVFAELVFASQQEEHHALHVHV
jgi:hypothetical protein